MKSLKTAAVLLITLLSGSLFSQTVWKIDPVHSSIQFNVSHMVVSEVTGYFKKFDAQVTSDKPDFTDAKISFTADVNSIFTDNQSRDNHLKSDDFFNAEKYPQIKFTGKSLQKVSDNKYKLYGDFTMRDVTKPVVLDVVYGGTVNGMGATKAGFKISGTVNRFDYNLKWNKLLEAGGATVGKDVDIVCRIELNKEATTAKK